MTIPFTDQLSACRQSAYRKSSSEKFTCLVPGASFDRDARSDFRRPNCPRCGNALLIAEQTAFNIAGCIRHTWSCDACAHEFATTILVWPQ